MAYAKCLPDKKRRQNDFNTYFPSKVQAVHILCLLIANDFPRLVRAYLLFLVHILICNLIGYHFFILILITECEAVCIDHRNNRHRMWAPISCQSTKWSPQNGGFIRAKLARPRTFCAKANGNF